MQLSMEGVEDMNKLIESVLHTALYNSQLWCETIEYPNYAANVFINVEIYIPIQSVSLLSVKVSISIGGVNVHQFVVIFNNHIAVVQQARPVQGYHWPSQLVGINRVNRLAHSHLIIIMSAS